MTEAELAASAANHAKKTTVAWADFLARVRENRYTPAQLRNTEWNKAGADLEAIKHLPTTPTPPPPSSSPNLNHVRNLVIWATVTDDAIQQACRLGPQWKFLFTSDPAYRLTDQQLTAARASRRAGCFAWSGPGIDPQLTIDFMNHRALGGWYGEGETIDGFDEALSAPTKPLGLIGNLSALRDDQRAEIRDGHVLFNFEAYRNIQAQRNADYDSYVRNTGPYAGLGGYSIACYSSPTENAVYTPVQWYIDNGYFQKGRDSVYTEGMRAEDWQALL